MPAKRPPFAKLNWDAALARVAEKLPAHWPPPLRRVVAIAGVVVCGALAIVAVPIVMIVALFVLVSLARYGH
jgi:hypothetical protein